MTRNLRYINLITIAVLLAACSTRAPCLKETAFIRATRSNGRKRKNRKTGARSNPGWTTAYALPQRKFLGMPIKLWLYNLGNEPKGKGLNHLLRNKWGEAPVW